MTESTESLRRKRNLYAVLTGVTAALMLIGAFLWGATMAQRADLSEGAAVAEQSEKKEIASEARRALCGTNDREIYDRDLCTKWAEAAQEPVIQPANHGPTQEEIVTAFRAYCAESDNCRGRDGATPTPDDIAAAFMTFCADGRCVGATGQKGEDGKNAEPLAPQYEMVLAAVADVCGTGACNGPAGRDGVNGTDGADATQEMVLAAVQTVCANDACRGPVGETGADGAKGDQGETGRGIADSYCQDSGLWKITYTDGAVDNDAGKCRPDPVTATPPLGGLL